MNEKMNVQIGEGKSEQMPLNFRYENFVNFRKIITYKEKTGSRFLKTQTGNNKFIFPEVLFLYISEIKEKIMIIETHTGGQIAAGCQF